MSTPQNLHEELTQTRDYITALESVIIHICEVEGIDAAALMENVGYGSRPLRKPRTPEQRKADAESAKKYVAWEKKNPEKARSLIQHHPPGQKPPSGPAPKRAEHPAVQAMKDYAARRGQA